ncbi:CsbD family protein [Prosthecobacter sp.]|uniref:CsbD family protein n=1 Tax=Prosthecobacter sp. TaxID=1965333 RepID=UPI003784A5F1
MNTILLRGDWNILKGKLKQAWALLTRDETEYHEGKAAEYLGRVQRKTGEKRAALKKARRECDELRMQIDQFPKSTSQCDQPRKPWSMERKMSDCKKLPGCWHMQPSITI